MLGCGFFLLFNLYGLVVKKWDFFNITGHINITWLEKLSCGNVMKIICKCESLGSKIVLTASITKVSSTIYHTQGWVW